LSEKFKLGVNAADFSNDGKAGYTGVALYPAVDVSDKFSLGLRGEYFQFKQGSGDNSVTALTLSANLKAGGLTFIPEFRLDNSSNVIFETTMGDPTKSASQFALAMVYGF
jgi:hypothetical protein